MFDAFSTFKRSFGGQDFVFFAMFHGVKKAMDYWVSEKHYKSFTTFCDQHKILYKTDVKFIDIPDTTGLKEKVIGGESLTSTKFYGEEMSSKKTGQVHMLLSMKQEYLDDIYKYAWYPVISKNNRVLNKNLQDIQDF